MLGTVLEGPLNADEHQRRRPSEHQQAVRGLKRGQQSPFVFEHDVPEAQRGESHGRKIDSRLDGLKGTKEDVKYRP